MRPLTVLVLVLTPTTLPAGELVVRTNFPGGSAKVRQIDAKARQVSIAPAGDPVRGWPAWWYFKLEGVEKGETITLQVGGGQKGGWALPQRAAFSLDNATWTHTEAGKRDGERITYQVKVEGTAAWFAWGPPFVLSHAEELIQQAKKISSHVEPFELCKTRAGRVVPAMKIAFPGATGKDRLALWVQARQHAWESGSCWVCRGFVEWLLSDDPRAIALRKKADVYVVPIMDVDNVETGNGGKNETPHDHNRDWSAEPIYPAVKAVQERIRQLNMAGTFALFVDLHNPGPGDRQPYFYVAPAELIGPIGRQNQTALLDAVRTEMTGPLKLGNALVSGAAYDKNWERISKNWVNKNCADRVVAVTLETAWNTPASTTAGYRTVGKQLGLGIERASREWRR